MTTLFPGNASQSMPPPSSSNTTTTIMTKGHAMGHFVHAQGGTFWALTAFMKPVIPDSFSLMLRYAHPQCFLVPANLLAFGCCSVCGTCSYWAGLTPSSTSCWSAQHSSSLQSCRLIRRPTVILWHSGHSKVHWALVIKQTLACFWFALEIQITPWAQKEYPTPTTNN